MIENIATKIGTRGAYTNELTGFAAVALYLQDSKPAVQFKALTTTVTEQSLLQSVENKNNIYFTPEGIMIGGFLIAEPNNPDVWAQKSDVTALQNTVMGLFNQSKAMRFAGAINQSGMVERLSDEVGAEFKKYISANAQPETLNPNGGSVSGSNTTFEFFETESGQETIPALNITAIAFHIYDYISNSGNPTNAMVAFGSALNTGGNPLHLRIVYSEGGGTTAIDKEISMPYSFTLEEMRAMETINYGSAGHGMWLYSRPKNGASGVYVAGSNSQFNTVNLYLRSVSFPNLSETVQVQAGYVFISDYTDSQNTHLISGVSIERGDLIIITNTVYGRPLTASDFVIISGRVDLAGPTNAGLMSAAHYNKLEGMDPSTYLTASDLPIFDTNDSNNSTGVAKTSSGVVKAKLSIGTVTRTPAQISENNNGLALCIEAPSGDRVGSVTDLPYAADNAWGVVRVDGNTIIADSNGVISATANLTWS